MKKYMYGLDSNDPTGSARWLAANGYDAVLLSAWDADAFAAVRDAGLESWLCFGAHAIGVYSQEEQGARDAKGERQWEAATLRFLRAQR